MDRHRQPGLTATLAMRKRRVERQSECQLSQTEGELSGRLDLGSETRAPESGMLDTRIRTCYNGVELTHRCSQFPAA
jgi:hypothetical protein